MNKDHPIDTARAAIDRLGEQQIADAVGVGRRTVRNKGITGFPAWWYPAVNDLAEASGAKITYAAFNFRRVA